MTNNQMFFALVTVLVAGFGFVKYYIDAKLDPINQRLGDFQTFMGQRFDDLKETWRAELLRVEGVLDARLKHFEERERER